MSIKSFVRKFTSPMVWVNLLALTLAVVLIFVGLIWWLDDYTHHGEGVAVPNFYGKSYGSSVSEGDSLGLVVLVIDSTYNKKLPAGCVVSQIPVAGKTVKEGRIVYVTINSLTMPRVAIPDIVGNGSYRQAQALLQALGFKLTEPMLIDGEKDWIYGLQCGGRNIVAGDMVAKESTLTLVIGNGITDEELQLQGISEEDEAFELDIQEGEGNDAVDPYQELPDF